MTSARGRLLAVLAAIGGAVAFLLVAWALAGAQPELAFAKDSKSQLQEDLKDTGLVGDWIYDDIDLARQRAAKARKPIFLVFR